MPSMARLNFCSKRENCRCFIFSLSSQMVITSSIISPQSFLERKEEKLKGRELDGLGRDLPASGKEEGIQNNKYGGETSKRVHP